MARTILIVDDEQHIRLLIEQPPEIRTGFRMS